MEGGKGDLLLAAPAGEEGRGGAGWLNIDARGSGLLQAISKHTAVKVHVCIYIYTLTSPHSKPWTIVRKGLSRGSH